MKYVCYAKNNKNKRIQEYASKHNLKITGYYSDTQSLLNDGTKRKFDCVILDSIKSFGSSIWEAKKILLETFYYAGIHFIVIDDGFDSGSKNDSNIISMSAEEYFHKKCSEVKRSGLINGDKPKTAKSSPQIPSLRGLIFNEYGERISESKLPITKEKFYQALKDALDFEKLLAEHALNHLKNGAGKAILSDRIHSVGKDLFPLFEELAKSDLSGVKFEKAYKSGKITEEEYLNHRAEHRKKLLESEEYFKEAEEKVDELEKAFGFKNPWIVLMSKWNAAKIAELRSFVAQIIITENNTVKIITKADKWKNLLPAEFLSVSDVNDLQNCVNKVYTYNKS